MQGRITRIRSLEANDLDSLYQWYNNHEFSYWVSGNWPLLTLLRREEFEQKFYDEDLNRYAITNIEDEIIGTIGFDEVNIPARSARLFIGIGPKELWGQGYGTDSLRTFINYLFNQWNFRRLTVEIWAGNLRALSCYTSLGFVEEGRLREAYYIDGKYYDGIILGLLKKNYQDN
ncbi:MAG: acetyltransferase [Gracilibacter sp. BRH_c7a]|nr:MAG: acetyltransferase [Gracilibacter sp. BRH_c7a]